MRVGVLEGDVQGSMDADRLSALHVPVTQLNTDNGFGGECHLDANMVRSALPEIDLDEIDMLLIENVGNLVCPAEFRVGEDARAMVSSVAEGEDKPLKYPLMFRTCEFVVVNKIDLLPYVDFDVDRFLANLDQVNPGVEHALVSARTGEGVDAVPGLAGRGGARGRPRPRDARLWPRPVGEAARAADRGERALLRRGGRAHRAALPPDGGALRTRRAAGAPWARPPGALRRSPRGRRVRAPGDRGQARPARASG